MDFYFILFLFLKKLKTKFINYFFILNNISFKMSTRENFHYYSFTLLLWVLYNRVGLLRLNSWHTNQVVESSNIKIIN